MKVLSLIEPWATLIKERKKVIETRSWKTSYRGELYTHASSKKIERSDAHTSELLKLIPNVLWDMVTLYVNADWLIAYIWIKNS